MVSRRLLYVPVVALGFAWSAWFLWESFGRWRFARICTMACGPFFPAELAEHYERAFDWQSPLLIALLPLVTLACFLVLRASWKHRA